MDSVLHAAFMYAMVVVFRVLYLRSLFMPVGTFGYVPCWRFVLTFRVHVSCLRFAVVCRFCVSCLCFMLPSRVCVPFLHYVSAFRAGVL